jgi:hypothetical protein
VQFYHATNWIIACNWKSRNKIPKRLQGPEGHLPKANLGGLELARVDRRRRSAMPSTFWRRSRRRNRGSLAGQKSESTRRAYQEDVRHFIRTLELHAATMTSGR